MDIVDLRWSYVTENGIRGAVDLGPTPSKRGPRGNPRWLVSTPAPDRITSLIAEVTLADGWIITAAVPFVDGEQMLDSLTIRHRDGPQPAIRARVFHRFRVGEIEKLLKSDTPWIIEGLMPAAVRPTGYSKPSPGQRGETNRFYAEKARRYIEATERTKGRPVPLLVHEDGNDTPAERRRWPVWMKKAEERGLITPRQQGKASAELTDKAIRILNGESE